MPSEPLPLGGLGDVNIDDINIDDGATIQISIYHVTC